MHILPFGTGLVGQKLRVGANGDQNRGLACVAGGATLGQGRADL